ncbi:MAG: hypothetical protein NT004_15135 [Bacteroidetes bacterium]|nr:hypothetical protein [Bacteroidota bacterium]
MYNLCNKHGAVKNIYRDINDYRAGPLKNARTRSRAPANGTFRNGENLVFMPETEELCLLTTNLKYEI